MYLYFLDLPHVIITLLFLQTLVFRTECLVFSIKGKKIEIWQIAFVLAFIAGAILVNAFAKMDLSDDAASKAITEGYTMFEWVKYRYLNWSARVLQEGMGFYLIWHPFVWKIINTVIYIAFPFVITRLVKGDFTAYMFSCAAFLIYPILDLRSAGWICTTITYFWPAFFGVCCCLLIRRCCSSECKIKWFEYPLFYIALLLACDHELLAAFLFMIISYSIIYCIVSKIKVHGLLISALVINALNLAFILLSPGNSARSAAETNYWDPVFGDLTLPDKIYKGLHYTCNVYIYKMNAVYIVLALLTALAAFVYARKKVTYLVASLPSVILFVLHHVFSIYDLGQISDPNLHDIRIYIPIAFMVISFGAILFTLFDVFGIKDALTLSIVLLGGLSTTAVMGFSPTVYASGARTSIFTNFAMIYVIVVLLGKLRKKELISEKALNILASGVALILVISNVLLMKRFG